MNSGPSSLFNNVLFLGVNIDSALVTGLNKCWTLKTFVEKELKKRTHKY